MPQTKPKPKPKAKPKTPKTPKTPQSSTHIPGIDPEDYAASYGWSMAFL
jgi:hypothetical protein